MQRLLIGLFLLFSVASALADEVEVIPLRHRSVEQVAPVLRALVDPGGAVSGMQSTLVIRSSRRNIEDLKRVLATLDQPARRLLISVRQDTGVVGAEQGGGVGTRPGGIDARIYSNRSASDEKISQQVQTLDGASAYIQIGLSVPIRTQTIRRGPGGVMSTDTVTYRDVATGFSVLPRLSGEQVVLEISPQREAVAGDGTSNPPVISSQRVVSSVAGRLGEWLEIGGMVQDDRRDERGILSSASASRQDNRRVWVRVDALP